MDEPQDAGDAPPQAEEMGSAPREEKKEEQRQPFSPLEWYSRVGWKANPFTFAIVPSIHVGYGTQKNELVRALVEQHKLALILGPTGSGKTSLVRWASSHLPPQFDFLYVAKPPARAEEFIGIFNDAFPVPWYRFFERRIKTMYQMPDVLNGKLRNRRLVVFLDEAQEADMDVLEWLRVLSDQVDNMSLVLSALPVFEEQIRDKLETLRKRVAARIEVLYLTKEEVRELVEKRIAHAGGTGIEPFDESVIGMLYERTGGFPREILRMCDELANKAISEGKTRITADMLEKKAAPEKGVISLSALEQMTPMQRDIIDMLAKGAFTPGDLANMLSLEKYKSRQHAVRSVNNILKRMLEEGLVERSPKDKAYVYHLSPKLRTLVVKA